MDLRHLRAFVAVFEERNITQAAERLHITQSALSVTIRQLEQELAAPLFARQARGVEVTEAARLLYPRAVKLLGEAQGIARLFVAAAERASLRLGIEPGIGAAAVAEFLALVHRVLPQVQLSVAEGCTGDARFAVEDQRCEDELFVPWREESFVLAAPEGDPLAQAARLAPREVAGVDWVVCPQHDSHQRLLTALGGAPHRLAQAARVEALALAPTLVAAGLGWAWLPAGLVRGAAGVKCVELDAPALTRRLGLCLPAGALQIAPLRRLHQALSEAPRP